MLTCIRLAEGKFACRMLTSDIPRGIVEVLICANCKQGEIRRRHRKHECWFVRE
jgi:hypothetical protein